MILAHGLGGRADLPVPLWLALYAGAFAVLVSFFALTAFWTRPKLRGAEAGHPLPGGVRRVADAPLTRRVLRGAGLVGWLVLLAAAWLGPDSSAINPASTWFYVWFWVGLVPLSLLFGPAWRLANPLRTLAALVPRRTFLPLPARLGYWPAVAGLLAFLWLELVYDRSDSPRAIAVFLTGYTLVQVAAGAVYGSRWFGRGDGFEVYANLLARLAPVGRGTEGRLVLRNPLDGLVAGGGRGLTPVVLVLLGATAFDGVTRLPVWTDLVRETGRAAGMLLGTAGLAGAVAVVALAYAGGIRLTRPYLRKGVEPYGSFAHSLIPIAVGYTVAHYFSFAVFQGQAGYLLLGSGAGIDYTVVSASTIAFVQVAGIVIGHVVGVAAAHDRALQVLRPAYVKVGQFPMLAVMVGYTTVGIALVSGA
ncbi:hypothetical protein SAMN05421810_10565 [Amycolatopsis arida]|uniref:Fenitrothion hydrolase n=1 Tax=Amycolatopsis arida TaxID=587909 RepID=A0A1I5WE83_9PSEU|nr:hypothetical protein [Amycolatopsis arida]TDX92239.1 hypothetical protein CLV69_10584 [Amycolatopsis arida]SFQ18052.1 hypothetical protein SAMN05421810_10565 [Amycolatopsis arida]